MAREKKGDGQNQGDTLERAQHLKLGRHPD